MAKARETKTQPLLKSSYFWAVLALIFIVAGFDFWQFRIYKNRQQLGMANPGQVKSAETPPPPPPPQLDFAAYDKKLLQIANNPVPKIATSSATSTLASAKP